MNGQAHHEQGLNGWTPEEVVAAWPSRRYLAALCSGSSGEAGRWGRWSILTSPARVLRIGHDDPDPIGRMCAEIETSAVARVGPGFAGQTRGATRDLAPPHGHVPFVGGWIVALSYELGRSIEPSAAVGGRERIDPAWPWSIVMWRCPWAWVHDGAEGTWWRVGDASRQDHPYRAVDRFELGSRYEMREGFVLDEPRSLDDRAAFEQRVARIVEYIRAGDVFQANLSHRLAADFSGSSRSLFGAMLKSAAPWNGAYLELAEEDRLRVVASASPELFLHYHAQTRTITTRPIKGTIGAAEAGSEHALRASIKDQAELNMIVDLMRNDLGRVSKFGSVRVSENRVIERHGRQTAGILHGVSTINGTLRTGATLADLLRATFPGGSITGAPKVRAMQIIEELEPRPRGLYTGAIGYISDCGNMSLNIAIRTAVLNSEVRTFAPKPSPAPFDHIERGELTYGVGAGIVADSIPAREWEETMQKAGVVMGLSSPAVGAPGA